MKHLFCLLWFVTTWATQASQTVAVSAGDKLTIYRVAEAKLTVVQTIDLEGTAGPFGLSSDRKKFYLPVSSKETGSMLATFAIAKDGTLSHLHTAASGWTAGYLRADATNRFLAGSNYGAGKVGIWPLDQEGIYQGEAPRDFVLEKNAHSSVFSPDNRFLFVPATGPNKIFQLVFNPATGAVQPNHPPSAPGPVGETEAQQPRHLIFHPTKAIAYTTLEQKMPGVGVWKYISESGTMEIIQSLVSIELGDSVGMSTADLHLSSDQRFLFVSNRDSKKTDNPAERRDAIAVFKVDPASGNLSFVKRFPCEQIPRSFAVGLEDNLLFVSGQGDSKLGVYEIDPASGHLKKLETHDLPGKPSWVGVLPASD